MIKIYRKGTQVICKAKGINITVDDSAMGGLYNVVSFIQGHRVEEETAPVARKRRAPAEKKVVREPGQVSKPTKAAPVGDDFNIRDELVKLIAKGVTTEDGMVRALEDRLVASGKKSPVRSVNTALRHAKVNGIVKEGVDGSYSIATTLKAV